MSEPALRSSGAASVLAVGQDFTLATLASGASSGTAGAATTATSLAKPTAAPNWTAGDLVGRWLRVTGGGGYSASRPVLRPVLANTTTSLSVSAVAGLDSTTTFALVELDPVAPGAIAMLVENAGEVEIHGFRFDDAAAERFIQVLRARRVVVSGCEFAANTSAPGLTIEGCHAVTVSHCILTGGADVAISKCLDVQVLDVLNDAGGAIVVSNSLVCDALELTADGALSNVLRLEHVHSATASMDASDGGATPLYLEDVQRFESVGTHCVGTGNTGHGVEVQGSGAATLTGCTVTGTLGDVNFYGRTVTWAILSGTDYGIVEEHAGNARARASYTKAIKYGSYLFDGNIDVSGRLLLYGYLNTAVPLAAQTATGSDAATALNMDSVPALGGIEVGTTPSGTGVRLPSGAAVAGVIVWVVNRGANTLTVYAPASGTVDGGASVTIATGKAKGFMSLAGGLAFWTVAAT